MSELRRALLLDCETGGIDPSAHPCIEVGAILYDLVHAAPVASYASLILSETNEAEAINRIPVALLKDAPEPEKVWRMVEAMAAKADVIIAHRAEFDRSFASPNMRMRANWCCSKFWIQWPLGNIGDSLVPLALAHGVGVSSAHRALTDCDILSRLMTRVHEMGHPLPALIAHAMRPRVKVVSLAPFEQKDLVKAHGFAWDAEGRVWWREVPVDDVASLPFQTRKAS